MRVLVVSHIYAPEISPRAFRWSPIAEHWAARGHEVDVLCARRPESDARETIEGVDVTRVGGGVTELARSRLRTDTNQHTDTCAARCSLGAVAKWLHDQTWKKLYWPDYACLWRRPAVGAARKLMASHSYDALITVSDPFTSHLVGLQLKRSNPSLVWLVDLGDPFCFRSDQPTNNHRLYRRRNYAAERDVFRKANSVAVTCEAARAKYAEVFPESAKKVFVVPPLLSAPSAPGVEEGLFPNDGRIRLVYVGTLHRTIRNPGFLLELFRGLSESRIGDKLELHLFGSSDGFSDYFERHEGLKVVRHGLVARERAMQAMREADVLVNIGNTTPYQLPSKVVDYARTGKPVLDLTKSERDSSAEFFNTYPAHLNILENGSGPATEQVADAARFIEHLPPQVDPSELEAWLADYHIEAVAAAYERLIERQS